jgi:predicted transcriptional regulator
MKKVFTNSAEVLHLYAQQTQSEAKCSNVFFYDKKCYSYGYHYKLTEFIDDFILINDSGYSNTTRKHIAQVTGATRQYKQYFESNVLIEKVLPFVKSEYEKLLKAKKPTIYINSILSKFDAFNEYPLNKNLKDDKYKQLKNIANLVFKIASNVDNFKDTLKELKKANEKKQKAILNKSIKNFEEYKVNFIKAEEDYLRFSECGQFVETSQQVKVSKNEAKALYSLIFAKKDIKGYNISGYIVTSLNGTLKIGCHKINIHSMNKIGKQLINN